MLAGKMKEIKRSVRRVYMRLLVLGAVVVFGAIAIAQAQKAMSGGDEDNSPNLMKVDSGLAPIAKADTNQADLDGGVLPANAEFPEGESEPWPDDTQGFSASESQSWSTDDPVDDLVARRYPLDGINDAVADMMKGLPGRNVIVFDHGEPA